MPPKKKKGKGKKGKKGDDEEEKTKEVGKILENEIKTMQQRIGSILVLIAASPRGKQGQPFWRQC